MNHEQDLKLSTTDSVLQEILSKTLVIAEENQHNSLFLLSILRSLESIHRQIRTEMFEPSLPETRNDLYELVKDIEETGGWPYIERMKLQDLLQYLQVESIDTTGTSQK